MSTLKPLFNREILLYSLALAGLAITMKVVEYRYLVADFVFEVVLAIISLLFLGMGLWIGSHYKKKGKDKVETIAPSMTSSKAIESLGISPREHEVLLLIAKGLSNQEIADRLFVSVHTIKTHVSNLYMKLEVNRRTQAIQKAMELSIINPVE